jgi:hypothetical protein
MRKLLVVVLVLFAILVVDSVYLGAITFMQWLRDVNLEDVIYQSVFLVHLVLGLAIILRTSRKRRTSTSHMRQAPMVIGCYLKRWAEVSLSSTTTSMVIRTSCW